MSLTGHDITMDHAVSSHTNEGQEGIVSHDTPSSADSEGIDVEDLFPQSAEGTSVAAEGEYGERDGRFHGPDSTWKLYTHDIRELATSLDNIENNDLAIHLYNVHSLKVRLRSHVARHGAMSMRQKRSWIEQSHDDASLSYLPNSWTAWPLLPIDVPRQREVWGVPTEYLREQPGTYFKAENWNPSLYLQDEISAITLRIAKERIRQLRWAGAEDAQSPARSITRGQSTGASPRTEFAELESKLAVADTEEGADEHSAEPEVLQPSYRQTPLISSDDARCSQLLKPTTRHIIAKLDDLLNGLHRSRTGHKLSNSALGSLKRRSPSSSRVRRQSPVDGGSPTKRRRLEADSDNDSDQELDSIAGLSKDRKKTSHVLGCRDWSEVFSVALLVGWSPAIIKRAAHRCSAIFGEAMETRTMSEAEEVLDRIELYAPDFIPPIKTIGPGFNDAVSPELKEDTDYDDMLDDVLDEQDLLPCPKLNCNRNTRPFTTPWHLRAHLKTTHGYSAEKVRQVVPRKAKSQTTELRSERQVTDQESNTGETPFQVAMIENGFLQPISSKINRRKSKK